MDCTTPQTLWRKTAGRMRSTHQLVGCVVEVGGDGGRVYHAHVNAVHGNLRAQQWDQQPWHYCKRNKLLCDAPRKIKMSSQGVRQQSNAVVGPSNTATVDAFERRCRTVAACTRRHASKRSRQQQAAAGSSRQQQAAAGRAWHSMAQQASIGPTEISPQVPGRLRRTLGRPWSHRT